MLSVQKSLRLALVAAIALVVCAAESQAATPRYVFGKEPIARHNRAVAARKAQPSSGYRMMASNTQAMPSSTQSYGGTAMVQTYPVPQRSYVTPTAGLRPQMAANNGYIVR
ncbi:hypothetical protein AYO47_06410 [Planctomyces sp. SCGC AG-212-M04]|nr:hypothetical protein AYO47_06410 [Planctomyces sp. SCGC AG-212-M04]